MKALIVYYSRTGTTKKVAGEISRLLKCDVEEIVDMKSRAGALGFVAAGKDAFLKKMTKIKGIKKNPGNYDLIVG